MGTAPAIERMFAGVAPLPPLSCFSTVQFQIASLPGCVVAQVDIAGPMILQDFVRLGGQAEIAFGPLCTGGATHHISVSVI